MTNVEINVEAIIAEIKRISVECGFAPYMPTATSWRRYKREGFPTSMTVAGFVGYKRNSKGWAHFVRDYTGVEVEPRSVSLQKAAAHKALNTPSYTGEDVEFVDDNTLPDGLPVCRQRTVGNEVFMMLR